MHGDSLLMLTTKVVSNKKPPLLSDSESGGSTSQNSNKDLLMPTKLSEFINFRNDINSYEQKKRGY